VTEEPWQPLPLHRGTLASSPFLLAPSLPPSPCSIAPSLHLSPSLLAGSFPFLSLVPPHELSHHGIEGETASSLPPSFPSSYFTFPSFLPPSSFSLSPSLPHSFLSYSHFLHPFLSFVTPSFPASTLSFTYRTFSIPSSLSTPPSLRIPHCLIPSLLTPPSSCPSLSHFLTSSLPLFSPPSLCDFFPSSPAPPTVALWHRDRNFSLPLARLPFLIP
jgi:hypothetical protein